MPKLKSKRGAVKRLRVRGNGTIKFRRANRNHINTKRTGKQVRQGRALGVVRECDQESMERLLLIS
jgi:large subunit ribosomal protein L35